MMRFDDWEGMPWVKREYSKGQIDKAGSELITLEKDDPARERAITVVDNWRSCHSYPLQVIKMTLLNRAKKIENNALIAQRLKRRPSIEIKLRDNPNMKLSQMQDIGGCRAVMTDVTNVKKLVAQYKAYHAKSPKKARSSWDGSDAFDYIQNPKPDGYRSVHLIFRFQTASKDRSCFNGQRIEIQIRSKLQHVWATAVETAQIFTGQALKSKVKNASDDWLRFFALTSNAFAFREKSPLVPGTPPNRDDLVRELRQVVQRGKMLQILGQWNDSVYVLEGAGMPDAHTLLLVLDPGRLTLNVTPFSKEEVEEAQKQYELTEKRIEAEPNTQAVLVAVEDINALRKAYPNYYVDTKDFITAVNRELDRPAVLTKRRTSG